MASLRKDEFLHKALDLAASEPPTKRAWAVRTLAAIGSRKELPVVVNALRDPADAVRESAIDGLELHPRKEHVPLLAERLRRDSAVEVRIRAAQALGERTGPSVATLLMECAESDPERSVRAACLNALASAKPRPPGIGPRAAAILASDPAPNVRHAAVYVVKRCSGKQAADILAAAFEREGHWYPRRAIVDALGRNRSRRASATVVRALSDVDRGVRVEALGALAQRARPEAEHALLGLLGDEDEEIRDLAADALLAIDPGPSGSDATLQRLLQWLSAPHPNLRQTAAHRLAGTLDPRAVAPLRAALRDDHREVRRAAASALGQLGDDSAVADLCARLADDAQTVRAASAHALREIDDSAAVESLRGALRDPSPMVRSAAVLALADIGGPASADDLLSLRDDDEMSVRHNVAHALSKLGDPRGVLLLEQVLRGAKELAECPDCGEFYPVEWEDSPSCQACEPAP